MRCGLVALAASSLPTPRILHLPRGGLRISREPEVPTVGPKENPALFRAVLSIDFNRGAKQ